RWPGYGAQPGKASIRGTPLADLPDPVPRRHDIDRRPHHAGLQPAGRRTVAALRAQGAGGRGDRRRDLRLLPARPASRGGGVVSIDTKQDRAGRWLAIVASAEVLATVGIAVMVMDSPAVQRDGRLDSRRIDELNRIVQAIDTYVQANYTLPPDLATLAAQPGQQLSIADPVTGTSYDYTVDGARSYTLCAVFVTDTAKDQARGGPWNAGEWNHDVGPQCFSRTATARKPGSQASAEVDSPVPSAPAESEPAASGAPAARLALEGEGLRIFVLPSGSARPIAFGTEK